jgi:hypothetical protein
MIGTSGSLPVLRTERRSRILDERGRIEEIVNNYEWIHFDFGPTLLRWLERRIHHLCRDSPGRRTIPVPQRRPRNAIAQAYNHRSPLASLRGKRTQVVWGLRDFERRFGQSSESIWLPETAIDGETLRVLVEFGIRYVIHCSRVRQRDSLLGGGAWTDVSGGRIDPRRAYRIRLKAGKDRHDRRLLLRRTRIRDDFLQSPAAERPGTRGSLPNDRAGGG